MGWYLESVGGVSVGSVAVVLVLVEVCCGRVGLVQFTAFGLSIVHAASV